MKLTHVVRTLVLSAPIFGFGVLTLTSSLAAQSAPLYPNFPSETPPKFEPAGTTWDYSRREVMVPMRDGVRLHTVILVPKGASHATILLTRTPYNASDQTGRW